MSLPTSAFTRNMNPVGLRITVWGEEKEGQRLKEGSLLQLQV